MRIKVGKIDTLICIAMAVIWLISDKASAVSNYLNYTTVAEDTWLP